MPASSSKMCDVLLAKRPFLTEPFSSPATAQPLRNPPSLIRAGRPGGDPKTTILPLFMDQENYSRRRFVRRSVTLAGASVAWNLLRSGAQATEQDNPQTPDEALKELIAGNERYITGEHTHHDYGPERLALALSQHPFAAILGCADSRVSPELAFDQSRGSLFVVRLAGNFADDNGVASLEFATSVLGTSLIMVLGHTECGAVKAAIDVFTKGGSLPGHLPKLVSNLQAPVENVRSQSGSILDNATRENVVLNVQKIQTSEPILAALVKENRLKVVGGIYDLATGKITLLS
jgi:carbonic anhydrase